MTSRFGMLAEDAVRSCDRLEACAAGVWADMTRWDEAAGRLAEALESETSALCSRLAEVTEEAAAFKTRLAEAAHLADTAVGELSTTTDDVVVAFEQARAAVQESTRQVGGAAEAAAQALQAVAETVDGVRASAEKELRRSAASVSTEAQLAVAAIQAAGNACHNGRDSLHRNQRQWCGALDQLTIGTGELVKATLRGLAAVADEDARGTVDALNAGVAGSNALADRLQAHPADLAEAMGAAVAPVNDAGEGLAAAAAEKREGLTLSEGRLTDEAEGLRAELEALAQDLGALGGMSVS